MKIFGYEIVAKRWPWQDGYDWHGMTNCPAPLNPKGARFGGGWKYKLGISVSGSSIMVDLVFGLISIQKVVK